MRERPDRDGRLPEPEDDCTAVIDNQCVGPVVPPLLPGPGPVRVGLEGGVGVGI